MGKQVFILNCPSGSAGVAKILSRGKRSVLSVYLEKNFPGKKVCRILCGEKIIDVGSFYKNSTDFEIDSDLIVDQVYIEDSGNALAWSGEKPETAPPVTEESSSDNLTFDNFFGGGFEWHRIRGNFIMFDYSIVHHVLSCKNVYPAINRAGYYCAGKREDENLTLIAIAIPLIKGVENPFSGISADSYRIKSGKLEFDALCVGIDKTGEFFISI